MKGLKCYRCECTVEINKVEVFGKLFYCKECYDVKVMITNDLIELREKLRLIDIINKGYNKN